MVNDRGPPCRGCSGRAALRPSSPAPSQGRHSRQAAAGPPGGSEVHRGFGGRRPAVSITRRGRSRVVRALDVAASRRSRGLQGLNKVSPLGLHINRAIDLVSQCRILFNVFHRTVCTVTVEPAGIPRQRVRQGREYIPLGASHRPRRSSSPPHDVFAPCAPNTKPKGSDTHVRTVSIEPVRSLCNERSRPSLYPENYP